MKNYTLKLRHLGLLAAFILLAGSLRAQSGLNVILNKLVENNKMTTVTLSKEMIAMTLTNVTQNSIQSEELKKMVDEINELRIVSSEELTSEEQVYYNDLITGFLNGNGGYKDYMSINTKLKGKETIVRMCVKNIDKDYISEFIMFVNDGPKLFLFSITGKIENSKVMLLTTLSKIKNETLNVRRQVYK